MKTDGMTKFVNLKSDVMFCEQLKSLKCICVCVTETWLAVSLIKQEYEMFSSSFAALNSFGRISISGCWLNVQLTGISFKYKTSMVMLIFAVTLDLF